MGNFFKTKLGYFSVVLVLSISALFGTKVAYEYFHFKQNKTYLQDLSQRLLVRAELAADYAILALHEANVSAASTCDVESINRLSGILYSRGNIKDIAILDKAGNIRCTAIASESAVADFNLSEKKTFISLNENIKFLEIGTGKNGLIGISWQFENSGLMALINLDTLLFDVFPSDWRDNSVASIGFNSENPIGARDNAMASEKSLVTYSASSSRYPLFVELSVKKEQLITHQRGNELAFIVGGGILGIIFSLLVAQLLSRPDNPVTLIKRGIEGDEFIPFVQPLFDLKSRKIIGGEALMRWVKPDGEMIPPYKFIPIAEDSGLIVQMTRTIIKQTLEQVGDILNRDQSLKISFNIIPADLASDCFVNDLMSIVGCCNVRPEQIVLEITERQEIEDTKKTVEQIKILKDLGFRVALDDTGTGHNGLSYVQDLQADIIKIDKKFVDFISDDGGDEIVQILVQLAKRMKMETIAEGVETEKQAKILTKLGVDQGQGYLIAKPMPPEEFCAQVDKQRAL
jgi:sensor c-di-GMP phosphodiesterase-like protein